MTEAWDSNLPTGIKFVLITLCDISNDDGYCWPSIKLIAARCSMVERSVQNHIKTLVEMKIVTRDERPGRSTVYYINPRNICTPADIAPPQTTTETPANNDNTPANFAPTPPKICTHNHQVTINEPSIKNRHKASKPKMVTRPTDWKPNDTHLTFAAENGLSMNAESDAFADHHDSKGSQFADWDAAFRNWLRNAVKFAKSRPNQQGRSTGLTAEQIKLNAQAMADQFLAESGGYADAIEGEFSHG